MHFPEIGRGLSVICAVLALSFLVVFAGCGGGGGGGATGGSGTGTLDAWMADGPPDSTITSVEVDVPKVEARVGSIWQTISTGAATYDLLDYTLVPVKIGTGVLPTGNYTQVRFFVTECRVTDSTGTHLATIPAGNQSGIIVPVQFNLQANATTSLILDFSVDRSLVKLGNGSYLLQPVIPADVMASVGTVTGISSDGTNVMTNVKVWAVYQSGGAYQQNWPVNVGSSIASGQFKIWVLKAGTYRLDLTWTDGSTTKTATVNNVVVSAGGNTDVGTVVLN